LESLNEPDFHQAPWRRARRHLNNPPVNALGHAVRVGLVAAIEEADADDAVKAVVIVCQGQTFFAGADITEFGKPMQLPMLPIVVDIIENCTKPVVAAIHGTAFGGGLEVALASHYRVAVPSAKLGVPEVKLGLLPGAGGTQRLPRAAGVAKALEMAATGNPIGAREAHEIGLVDRLIEGDLEQHAVAFAEEVRDIRPDPEDQRTRRQARRGARQSGGVRRVPQGQCPQVPRLRRARIQCPRDRGGGCQALCRRRSGRAPPVHGADERHPGRAQQYFFFAERKAAKIDGLPTTRSRAK
jgi:3-hydroxyacyl-CoA dehydrogenase